MTNTEINEAVARKLGYYGRIDFTSEHPMYPIPDYCSSIQAAWEIPGLESVVRLENGRWHARFGSGATNMTYYEIGIYDDDESPFTDHVAFADTAPMAICLAFLEISDGKN